MLLLAIVKCLISFRLILKCLTLNGREMPFYAKINLQT